MLEFFDFYKCFFINLLNFYIWLFLYKKRSLGGINKIIVKYFLIYLIIVAIWDSMMNISSRSSLVYLIFWTLLSIYELYFIVTIFSFLKKWKLKWPAIIIFSLPILIAPVLALKLMNYQPTNIIGFFQALIMLIFCIFIINAYLKEYNLLQNPEGFFIFMGLILFFSLHILDSTILAFDFLGYWWLTGVATLIAHFFWLGSALYIFRVKSLNF